MTNKKPLQYGCYYHIYNRGNNRENLFVERRNYPYFLKLYAHHIQPIAETYAYCLLPNHFHFAIRTYTEAEQEAYWKCSQSGDDQSGSLFKSEPLSNPDDKTDPDQSDSQNGSISKIEPFSATEPLSNPDDKTESDRSDDQSGPILEIGPLSNSEPLSPTFKLRPPSRAFNNMFIAYARAFNKATQRTGALFESPFGRKIVDTHPYLITLITYIHRNPQKHGFVTDFREWLWSSYHAMLSSKPTKVQRDEVLTWYHNRSQFIKTHLQEVDEQFIASLIVDDWD
ncbi:hypothetical protein QUF64_09880 [Anaerolineales bacterium HSG6]|nr:hypothetical protein [Anaerolineales bacterium HSG6]